MGRSSIAIIGFNRTYNFRPAAWRYESFRCALRLQTCSYEFRQSHACFVGQRLPCWPEAGGAFAIAQRLVAKRILSRQRFSSTKISICILFECSRYWRVRINEQFCSRWCWWIRGWCIPGCQSLTMTTEPCPIIGAGPTVSQQNSFASLVSLAYFEIRTQTSANCRYRSNTLHVRHGRLDSILLQ